MKQRGREIMSWFDGTTTVEWLYFENEFPKKITEDFRMNRNGDRLAIINRFPKGSREYRLADPHMEKFDFMNGNRFYHVVTKKDAGMVQNALKEFLAKERKADETD
ncbi:MAG: hypothetical protein KBS45_05695, partial [Clostridiales bacterium]|nr:hypothetical protein [Candidatus Coliplasma caballi]